MTDLFLKIVNASLSASWLVLAVLVVRFALKKAPKCVSVLLWGMVAVRLICPFSIESAFSLVPSTQAISPAIMTDATPTIQTGIPALNSAMESAAASSLAPAAGDSADTLQIWLPVLAALWLFGVAALLVYTAISYWRLRRKVSEAIMLMDGVYQSDNIDSPFVLGIVRPKIYLPYETAPENLEHVIAHERAHILRKDHWWKPLGFLLLTIHWFNPLMWLAYVLLCRDIELACDEKVIRDLGNEARANYTQALVSCSIDRRSIAACPLAFGEVGIKQRVRSVMNYKKPGFWVVTLALVACAAVAVCFLTDPEPSREFALQGSNVSDLDVDFIIAQIRKLDGLDDENIYVNSDNFNLTLDSNFNWIDFEAVRYYFYKNQQIYNGQLRIYGENNTFFIGEPSEWVEQDRLYLLTHYLQAVKYLPMEEIRQLAPADQYLIDLMDAGTPADYDRVITYSANGAEAIDGWFIHLRMNPLHENGDAYYGTGAEVVDLFYGPGAKAAEIAFELNFAGNSSLQHSMELTEDKKQWRITVENSGEKDIVMELNSVVYRIAPGSTDAFTGVAPEPGTYSISFAASGAGAMYGSALCEVYSETPVKEHTYLYEGDGFGGGFTITLYSDGTYSYYEGLLSSYIGTGNWTLDGDTLSLTDDAYSLVNRFRMEGDDLVFIEDGSTNFVYLTLPDGAKFKG